MFQWGTRILKKGRGFKLNENGQRKELYILPERKILLI